MADQPNTAAPWLEEEEFYNICQYYRHVPVMKPAEVFNAFLDLKEYIRQKVAQEIKETING